MVGREVSLTSIAASRTRPSAALQVDGPDGQGRPRQRGRPRRRPRGPRRRDPRHRRRRRQRPGRARRGDRRAAQAVGRARSTLDGERHHRPESARASTSTASATCRPTATGSGSCCRSARRQPRPDRLPPAAVRARHPPQRRGHQRSGRRARSRQFDIRTPSARCQGRDAVRRQPAEGRRRPRVRPRPAAARPRPADTRPRRRQHRVHPQAGDRQARRRDGRPARLGRARRGARAVRPDRGHVPRPARRRRATAGRPTRTTSGC